MMSHASCPYCGEHKIRPSMRAGFLDLLLEFFSLTPYRCRGCRARFYWPRGRMRVVQ
ncbi:MAG: hypothetical protein HYR60_03160 [Acidobacteria bacterium]|nr:hypothetical protein [Acidobacteriota bacterium]